MNKIEEKIISTVEWQGKLIIATEHHLYELIDGEAVLMEFQRHDSMLPPEEQFEKKWADIDLNNRFSSSRAICKDWFIYGYNA